MPASHVPPKSLRQGHAAYTPHTRQTAIQGSSAVIPRNGKILGSDVTWFANDASSVGLLSFVSLPLTLPTLREAFNCRSLPWCFHQSSTKWFAINACTSNAVGLLPSLRKLLTDSTERATSKCHFIIVTHVFICKDTYLIINNNEWYVNYDKIFKNNIFIDMFLRQKYINLWYCKDKSTTLQIYPLRG